MKQSLFRTWVEDLWMENREERLLFNEDPITIKQYWDKYKYWLKREYRHQMTKEPKLEVVFVPGCFDSFDGTQEELDALQKEIMEMFANKSKEEIEFMSTKVESLDDLDDEDLEVIAQRQIRNLQ